ncbi:MAG: glycosyltransferase family A protein [Anaerolineae bacterium]
MKFYVVIPMYNEAKYICDALNSLAAQSDDDFKVVLVDNGSTDHTVKVVNDYLTASDLLIELIHETQKGTGAAADTGFRHAIAQGATHIARTDADCVADVHWVRHIKKAFIDRNLALVGGVIRPRSDEGKLSLLDHALIPFLLLMADITGGWRRRGAAFLYPYFLVAGNNMAVTAKIYEHAGGFPRSRIEEMHEDRELSETIRKLTSRGGRARDVIVYNSLRRVREYGYMNTILWYWDHHYTPQIVDVR